MTIIEQYNSKFSAFEHLANSQRGDPEIAMERAQHVLGGGVLSVCIEHVGDLTHRMCHLPEFIPYCGYEMVKPKVTRCLNILLSPYGFEREVSENHKANASYRKVDAEISWEESKKALAIYATAHAALPVFNEAQRAARDAAVALGNFDFDRARKELRILDQHLETPEAWEKFAGEFSPNYQ